MTAPNALRALQLQSDAMARAAIELRGPRVNVYAWLNRSLGFSEFEEVSVGAVAKALKLSFSVVADSLRQLTRAGFLEASPVAVRPRRYRLVALEPPRDIRSAS